MFKITTAVLGGLLLIIALGTAGASGMLSTLAGQGTSPPSRTAMEDIPAENFTLYTAAAQTCPGLDWSVLAAIGKIETNHGRSTLPGVSSGENFAGARGPMQFLQLTFDSVVAEHPPPPGGAHPPSPYNLHDAVYAAAAYLCDSGARDGRDLNAAIFAYNRADWYVADVLAQAAQYQSPATIGGDTDAAPAALTAINYAEGQLGLPYLWGGDGPAENEDGFDCSGLTRAAYAAAGIQIPRVAQDQYDAGPRVPAGQPLEPGDLVFYGTPDRIHHVGIYIGAEQMIHAPRTGELIQIAPYRYTGDDYVGATRPAFSHQRVVRVAIGDSQHPDGTSPG
ncbi:C40 family peptidase [Streptomyces millisiae]|uniref:C40 family peptidase n=1 Tax=Streptomyces millisiae TaxID=3075542 RepID=A0ABU2LM16_9ACTN|nr:C40 family peptidase [Streptomyces sp. DSM 44918]MDT0318545.1 C40 family peptidase [Streptomyces sp. DSM 44918]